MPLPENRDPTSRREHSDMIEAIDIEVVLARAATLIIRATGRSPSG